MSILDKISSMFGSKGEEEPTATSVEPVVPATSAGESAEPAIPDIIPQPDLITPEEGAPVEEPEKEESGEGEINLSV